MLGLKKKKSKYDAEVVGVGGRKVAYIIFRLDGEVIPDSLFRLTHPGNIRARDMIASAFGANKEEDDINFSIQPGTKIMNFFSECVKPVRITGVTPLEDDLINKYGANNEDPDPDSMPPKLFDAWEKVQALFFGGDLWDFDVPPVTEKAVGKSDPEKGSK